ncbi:MAG: hypothetical protein JNL83_16105 [Myxococcales bacterium]|nr:hypothetical protein [Myxococcales bacterium]
MIASRTSWRLAWLAAALLAGLVVAFARVAATTPAAPSLALPSTPERIDDGRHAKPTVTIDRSRGILEDTPVRRVERRSDGYLGASSASPGPTVPGY